MYINEIETIPQGEYRGGKAYMPATKYNSYDSIKSSYDLRPLPEDPRFEYYVKRDYDDISIYVLDTNEKIHVAKLVLEKLYQDTNAKFTAFPLPKSYTVVSITTHENYRNMGLALSLYKLVLNKLGLILVSGHLQTRGGQRNWASLYRATQSGNLPGVEITGWVLIQVHPESVMPQEMKYYDELFGKHGGVYIGKVGRYAFYEIPIGLASDQQKLETLVDRSKIKIYVRDKWGALPYSSGLMAKRVE